VGDKGCQHCQGRLEARGRKEGKQGNGGGGVSASNTRCRLQHSPDRMVMMSITLSREV
jgi:hypothetical protein